MKDKSLLHHQAEIDLGVNAPFVKGQMIPVRNCWHFSTDGDAVDSIFRDEEDFIDGMNRVYVVLQSFHVIILAFALMDTHVHFVLYGDLDECNRFLHEYIRRTSMAFSHKYGEDGKFENLPIDHQSVDNDLYLKDVICYDLRNPVVAGIPYHWFDYPWSSGALYFRSAEYWSSPVWTNPDFFCRDLADLPIRTRRDVLKSDSVTGVEGRLDGRMIFPGEYVDYRLVEQVFKTHKSFNYFMSKLKESDIDSRGGVISHLSIPMREMRQHRDEILGQKYPGSNMRSLDTTQRIILAKMLRSRYNSSIKQITRLVGLVYDEVKDLI